MDFLVLIDDIINIAHINNNEISLLDEEDNIQTMGECYFNNNILNIEWKDNKKTQNYYLIDEKYCTLEYIENNMNYVKINHNKLLHFILKDNKATCIEFNNYGGKFEIINDILIIYFQNNMIIYHEKDKNDIYQIITVPKYFDCNYYILNSSQSELTIDDFNNWQKAIKYWMIYDKNNKSILYCHQAQILMDDITHDIIISHTHKHIQILDENKYYKYNLENNILIITYPSFCFNNNEIIFEHNNKYTKNYIKEDNIYRIVE
jgi:hypothetical protein